MGLVRAMIDVHHDELKHCLCKTAFLYVHPNDYKPDGTRTAREAWVRIPGKHRNKDAAWDALENIIAHAALSCRSGGRSHRAGLAAFGAIFH